MGKKAQKKGGKAPYRLVLWSPSRVWALIARLDALEKEQKERAEDRGDGALSSAAAATGTDLWRSYRKRKPTKQSHSIFSRVAALEQQTRVVLCNDDDVITASEPGTAILELPPSKLQ